MHTYILRIQCDDGPGIVAKISNWLFSLGANIIRSDQFSTDPSHGQFFMRLEFCFNDEPQIDLQEDFVAIAETLAATWTLRAKHKKFKMGILVSSHDHCLYDLLYHYQSGELAIDIPFIISNHEKCRALAEQYQIPYHYLAIDANNKHQQEQEILALSQQTDFLVLARYMQILSNHFIESYSKDIINIHHSFLPSFIGANPYHQAYQRGVKLIGATAHYVTAELDQGPIISQSVEAVDHRDFANALKQKGKHIEKITLFKAVSAHIEQRVFRDRQRTIVF